MRGKTGVTVVGLWEKGRFEVPQPQTVISSKTLLLLAGTRKQLDRFETHYATPGKAHLPDAPVLILGGGRVGLSAAEVLEKHSISYRIVEKRNRTTGKRGKFN